MSKTVNNFITSRSYANMFKAIKAKDQPEVRWNMKANKYKIIDKWRRQNYSFPLIQHIQSICKDTMCY